MLSANEPIGRILHHCNLSSWCYSTCYKWKCFYALMEVLFVILYCYCSYFKIIFGKQSLRFKLKSICPLPQQPLLFIPNVLFQNCILHKQIYTYSPSHFSTQNRDYYASWWFFFFFQLTLCLDHLLHQLLFLSNFLKTFILK